MTAGLDTTPLHDFLLVYGADERQLLRPVQEFDDSELALAAFAEAEATYRGNSRVHVMLLIADSLETLKVTHRNFFVHESMDEVMAMVRRALAQAA